MSLSLDRMMALVRKGLGGLDSDDLDDAETIELLNLSLWELEDKFPFRAKETNFDITLVVSQPNYDLAALYAAEDGSDIFDSIESVSIFDSESQYHKLARTSQHWADENYNADSSTDARPERYVRRGNILWVYPAPDEALSMIVAMKESIASLASGTKEATGLPRNWDEIVVEGAISRGHFYAGDYKESREAANVQLTKIRSAVMNVSKEEKADSRYARLNVIWDEPEGV